MKKINKELIVLIAILSIFFIIFLTIALHRYWQYSAWYYDFGIFYTAISAVAQGKEPIIDHFVVTDKNIFADHFHPLIFIISPFLRIFRGGEVLLFFQTLFVTLSGIFAYLVAKEILKNKFESICFLIIYLSFVGLHNALITEFHEITLLSLPLMIFFYGMIKKNKGWYLLGLLTILLTKETTFIIPMWFGLLVAIKNKGLWRKIGLATIVGSLLYGLFVVYYLIPFFNDGESYSYLSSLNTEVNNFVIDRLKIMTILKTFLSFVFLPILAPEILPPVIFNWYSRFAISAATRHDLGMHYNAEIAPILFLSSVIGWLRIKEFFLKKKQAKASLFKIFAIFITGFSMFFSIHILKSPLLLFFNKAFYNHTKNFEFLDTLIENIPEDGVVMAQTNIAAKLAYRKVYMLRDNYADFQPDYIVIDARGGQEPNNFWDVRYFDDLLINIKNDPNYQLFYDQGEQVIYQKVELIQKRYKLLKEVGVRTILKCKNT